MCGAVYAVSAQLSQQLNAGITIDRMFVAVYTQHSQPMNASNHWTGCLLGRLKNPYEKLLKKSHFF